MEALAATESVSRAPICGRDARVIKNILKEAIDRWGWQDRIRHDSKTETDFIATTYIKHNEAFVYVLTTNEKSRRVGIHVNSPIQIPAHRIVETILVANYFNTRSATGSYHVTELGDLCYRWTISVADVQPSVELFRALRDAATHAFEQTYNPFLTAAFTTCAPSEITRKFEFLSSGS
jgi:hypothetical protein